MMRFKKKTLIALSVAVGVAVLATTAFVGAVNESAYEQLKSVAKSTTAKIAAESGNYTTRMEVALKDNGQLLVRSTVFQKTDGSSSEDSTVTELKSGEIQKSYSFNGLKKSIWYDAASDTYFVNEYTTPLTPDWKSTDEFTGNLSRDPLAQENIEDLEKILDAFVGNLKDYLIVTENEDGTRVFSGSLSDSQIPALVNALASFATKQALAPFGVVQPVKPGLYSEVGTSANPAGSFKDPDGVYSPEPGGNELGLPALTGDLFIKSVSGTATANADGIFTEGDLTVVLSGNDEDGVAHDLSLQLHVEMTEVGSTVVTEPDLTGKKVQITNIDPGVVQDKLTAAFVGTYRSDIVERKGDAFVRMGQRFIVIESVTDETVKGRYYEVYEEGAEGATPLAFDFEAPNTGYFNINFTFTDRNGDSVYGNMYFDPMNATVTFQGSPDKGYNSSLFQRMFD